MELKEYLAAINQTKQDIISQSESPEAAAKMYPSFVVARSLSYFSNTILLVNELNKLGAVENKQHFDFLLNLIPKGKRFATWHKPAKSDLIESLIDIQKITRKRAMELVTILTDEQLKELTIPPEIGGELKGKNK